jgi:hypothetical protein
MKTIEWMDVSPFADDESQFCCDASDIGLPPGGWPVFLKTGLGNGKDFVKQFGDENGYVYKQIDNDLRITIFND